MGRNKERDVRFKPQQRQVTGMEEYQFLSAVDKIPVRHSGNPANPLLDSLWKIANGPRDATPAEIQAQIEKSKRSKAE